MSTTITVWILDDSTDDVRAFKKAAAKIEGYDVKIRSFKTPDSLFSALNKSEAPDLAVLDIILPSNLDGFDICEEIKREHPKITVCMYSRFINEEAMLKASRCGASRVISKRSEIEIQLREFLKAHLSTQKRQDEKPVFDLLDKIRIKIIGQTTQRLLQRILGLVRDNLSLSILLIGDRGTGKSLILSALPTLLGRSFKVFTYKSPKDVDSAKGGWLLIDDLETLSYEAQTEIIKRIRAISFDVRPKLLITTSLNLEELTARAHTKEINRDLLKYLQAETVVIPPLSLRREEIPLIFDHFVMQLPNGPYIIDPEVAAKISASNFSISNVAELKEVVGRLAAYSESGRLTISGLPSTLLSAQADDQDKVKIAINFKGASFDDMTNHLLLEVVRLCSIQDRNAGRRTTLRSIERRFEISRSTVASRIRKMIEINMITKEEIEILFGGKWIDE